MQRPVDQKVIAGEFLSLHVNLTVVRVRIFAKYMRVTNEDYEMRETCYHATRRPRVALRKTYRHEKRLWLNQPLICQPKSQNLAKKEGADLLEKRRFLSSDLTPEQETRIVAELSYTPENVRADVVPLTSL